MKRPVIVCFGLAALLSGATASMERTWETPVMVTWTEDPRTTVTLAWERPTAGIATVKYGETGLQQHSEETQPDSVRRHVFTLRNLKPGVRYDYAVSSTDGYSAQGKFWTAPADPNEPFTFVLHNDLQGGINVDAAKAVSAGIVQAQPDFVLSTGDLADPRYAPDFTGGIHSWNLFFECLAAEWAAGVFQPVSGNHDEPENPDSFWHRLIELPDTHDYVLDVGPIRFVLVDSTESEAASRRAWLARELQKAAFDPAITWVVPAFHRPPFSVGERGGDDDIRNRWVPLFIQYEVDLVLGGHAHNYQRTRPLDGVTYLVSGGGGGWLYQVETGHSDLAAATSAFHFVRFRVAGDTIHLEAKLPDGTTFDRAELAAHRHVRVTPPFPARGQPCTISYDARQGPLAKSRQVTLHLGRDDFNEVLMDLPMVHNQAMGIWQATFTVPESPKWHMAFCFHDPETRTWHNNHTRNWQALLAREW